jgi:hypothetical protein
MIQRQGTSLMSSISRKLQKKGFLYLYFTNIDVYFSIIMMIIIYFYYFFQIGNLRLPILYLYASALCLYSSSFDLISTYSTVLSSRSTSPPPSSSDRGLSPLYLPSAEIGHLSTRYLYLRPVIMIISIVLFVDLFPF